MQKILVAIDGSKSCHKAAEKAKEYALLCRASVTFITIIEPKFGLVTSKEEFEEMQRDIEAKKESSNKYLDKCSEIYESCKTEIESSDLATKRVVKEGNNPAQDICRYADDNDFDLIVLADKGQSSIKDYLLGSTTEKVVRHADVSVMVVK